VQPPPALLSSVWNFSWSFLLIALLGQVMVQLVPSMRISDGLDHPFRFDPIARFGRTRSLIPVDPIARFGGPDR
jgi:hypothetical protein